ncbi:MAG TPA: glycine cleavage system protein H [Verrucomicrobiales bacterium]|nr:glycine cleavage system protein H [Verrucomicrobiales bacterium]|tara:strand:+ start:4116 stop:4592 length:477 start_codon:yes stop_codon:yes gene_type:complete
MAEGKKTLFFKRTHFSTHLPLDCHYSPSHFWAREADGILQIGFTKFATRMLGDMVDHGFEIKPETQIQPGQILGWVEGFKAISDVYSFSEGQFVGTNPALQQNIALINKRPYKEGWIYEVKGQLDNKCVDAEGYAAILNQTIDKMLEQQQAEKDKEIE